MGESKSLSLLMSISLSPSSSSSCLLGVAPVSAVTFSLWIRAIYGHDEEYEGDEHYAHDSECPVKDLPRGGLLGLLGIY